MRTAEAPTIPRDVGAFVRLEVGDVAVRSITDIDDVALALRHASAAAVRDWCFIDRLLDEWLELTR